MTLPRCSTATTKSALCIENVHVFGFCTQKYVCYTFMKIHYFVGFFLMTIRIAALHVLQYRTQADKETRELIKQVLAAPIDDDDDDPSNNVRQQTMQKKNIHVKILWLNILQDSTTQKTSTEKPDDGAIKKECVTGMYSCNRITMKITWQEQNPKRGNTHGLSFF